ncbi:hypothetical protein KAW38_03730 [Candidatus Micrarchaeota archaeon]|nr:hypothetical protein [Candidatus Micrarchaeota archaeon]
MVQKQFRINPERLKYLRNKFRKTDVLIDRNTREIIGKRLDFLMILNGHYKINFEKAKENRTIMAEVKNRFLAREDGEPVSDRARDDSYLSYEYEDNAKLGILIKDAILQMLRNYRVKELFDEGTIYVPRYSWKKPEVKRKAVKILLRVLEKDPRDITTNDFKDNRLRGLSAHHCNDSPYLAVKEIYPEIKEWEMKTTPKSFFDTKENRITATGWLIEKLNKNPRDITQKDFIDNRLSGLLYHHYKGSPYLAIRDAYPDIKEWEMVFSPNFFYKKKENRITAIRWLIEKLNKDPRDIILKDFIDNRLSGLLTEYYGNSQYLAIREAHPEIKEWEMKITPRSFFDRKKNRITATKWLIEKLNKDPRDITANDFRDNRLSGLLFHHYKGSPYLVIREVHPEIKEWEMQITSNSFYDKKENRINAIKWLIKKLNKNPRDITLKDFKDNRLGGLLSKHYKDSPYLAIREAYPKIKPEEMRTWVKKTTIEKLQTTV